MPTSNSSTTIQGVLPVLQTPFDEHGQIDVPVLLKEIDWAYSAGADGVVVAMVSEVLRIGYPARKRLAELVCETSRTRGATVISVGAESTDEAVELAQHAEAQGANAVMAIPPVATSLGGANVVRYFSTIAGSISIPLIVQDASSYVGAAIDLKVYLDLLDQFGPERILFKPEASPLGPNLSKLRDATRGTAKIYEGSGGINLVDCYRRGIHGTMPGMDLLNGIVALWKALQAGDDRRTYQLSLPICAIVAIQLSAGLDGFLAIEKYLLKKQGIFVNTIQKQPCSWTLDAETQAEVDRLFALLQSALSAN